jgi:hypothetical protein
MMTDREVVVLGYPGYDPTGDDEFQRIQNRIFRGTYYVKRLQPGLLRVRQPVESYKRQVQAATHDTSTLGGNSGSAVLVLPQAAEEHVQVIGLHFAGAYLVANYAVPTADLAQESISLDGQSPAATFMARTGRKPMLRCPASRTRRTSSRTGDRCPSPRCLYLEKPHGSLTQPA